MEIKTMHSGTCKWLWWENTQHQNRQKKNKSNGVSFSLSLIHTHKHSHSHVHTRTCILVQRTGCMKQTQPGKEKRTSSGILHFNYSKWHFLGKTIKDGCLFPGFRLFFTLPFFSKEPGLKKCKVPDLLFVLYCAVSVEVVMGWLKCH